MPYLHIILDEMSSLCVSQVSRYIDGLDSIRNLIMPMTDARLDIMYMD